ncbi:methylmalonyl Co-A mutase-associated GTPase MeaB [Thermodesulfobacteriota bacterium]
MDEITRGGKIAVADALNLLEDRRPSCLEDAKALIQKLAACSRPDRHVIGITGPPGVGKSTLISRIIRIYRSLNKSIGIISVDPSSRRSGGAFLGDRARIEYNPADPEIFIRSMATGGHLGGLSWRTRHCLTVFEAVYDVIILETVGAGQSEIEIENVADSVVFVIQPDSGDALQFMKAGIMEIPHVMVVNKADRKALAIKTSNDLQSVAHFAQINDTGWAPQVILTSAKEGWGQEALVDAMERHRQFLVSNNQIESRRARHRFQWVYMLFKERFGSFGVELLGGEKKIFKFINDKNACNPYETMEFLVQKMQKAAPGPEMKDYLWLKTE